MRVEPRPELRRRSSSQAIVEDFVLDYAADLFQAFSQGRISVESWSERQVEAAMIARHLREIRVRLRRIDEEVGTP